MLMSSKTEKGPKTHKASIRGFQDSSAPASKCRPTTSAFAEVIGTLSCR